MNNALKIRPGTMPPISSPEIEIPARLPSNTASPDGGIRMSTPPMARIGPIAVFGSYFRSSICGSSSEPSMAVVAMVEPEMAENIVPATSATTARRPGTRRMTASTASTDFIARPV